MHQTVNKNQII